MSKKSLHKRTEDTRARIEAHGTGFRSHGEVRVETDRKPSETRKAMIAIGAVGLFALGATIGLKEGKGSDEEKPTPTTMLPVDERGLWGAAEDELQLSGIVNPSNEQVSELTDQALGLNLEKNPNFRSSELQAGELVIVPDVPNVNQQP